MIQKNLSLKAFNSFGVEAKSKYFVTIKSVEALREVLQNPEIQNENLLFLGGGSNILLTKDFDGCSIQLDLKGISEKKLDDNHVLVTANAGENWHQFVLYCLEKNYGGLENLSLIPGNVGTSPMQNIGAYGTEIKDIFESCDVLNLDTLEVETFDLEKCRFGYRDSIFKQEGKGKYVILNVTFRLTTHQHQIKTEYGAIKAELEKMNIENPSIQEVSKAVIAIRESKLPNPKEIGNAGSFFKNPTIPLSQFEILKDKFPNIQGYPNGDWVKVPAGWLIEQCGWKGKQIGNVATHHLQSLVIINKTGNATGEEIFNFSAEIINSVKEKFKIELEREVNIL
ncbi:UDP-N-acetylmuramate dehydrogenase [Soonwooa buanensis]|uniref:UDP-N-acetylenolpyruvoylglucosamine reductase n=1 Tax=Soonwooa buanensis TaxID=619805 RepID=A0A1T5ES92_9FLAO|nr:UDP-N-acetylmuramate dehydrogenase [Soonwooa buanensis]SKB86570.1 UDP-N-acetylmuramate dehydrogenase [Soonwooa buanensis]